jgi:hypothetical protein
MYLKRTVFSLTMTIIIIKKDITSQISTKKPSIQVEFAKKKIARKLRGVIRFQVSLGNSIPK